MEKKRIPTRIFILMRRGINTRNLGDDLNFAVVSISEYWVDRPMLFSSGRSKIYPEGKVFVVLSISRQAKDSVRDQVRVGNSVLNYVPLDQIACQTFAEFTNNFYFVSQLLRITDNDNHLPCLALWLHNARDVDVNKFENICHPAANQKLGI